MDKDLSDLLSICLRLKAAPQELNQAVKKLVSNAALIEDLRFGLGLEETGTGLSPANLGPFQLECLELASCALNLEAYFSSARHLPERTEPPGDAIGAFFTKTGCSFPFTGAHGGCV